MTQEFVTLLREVVEHVLKAMGCGGLLKQRQATAALHAALKQPQDHILDAGNMTLEGWKLVPVEPNDDMDAAAETDYEKFNGGYFPNWKHAYRAMLDAAPQPPALEQPQNHVPEAGNMVPAGWKLVPVVPTQAMIDQMRLGWSDISTAYIVDRWKRAVAAAPKPPTVKEPLTVKRPQADQPAMTPIAQRKLEDLMASGYTISGYSVYHERKHQHGFVTGAGLVGWWKPDGVEYPQPRGERDPVAEITGMDEYGPMLGWHKHWAEFPIGTKLYTHQQNLNCKSTQARLATLWGYVKEQPKREPLTHYEIHELFRRSWDDRQDGDEIKAFAPAPSKQPTT